MLDLRLKYMGGGTFQTATKLDFELAADEYEQGETVRAKTSHARSVRQNAYFHALVEAAWENQRGGPRLPSWRHLKSWLLIRAGHCDVKRFEPEAMTREVAAFLRVAFDTIDVTADAKTGEIIVKVARSVRFGQGGPGHDKMCEVVDRVVALICDPHDGIVPGMDPASIMDHAKARAA